MSRKIQPGHSNKDHYCTLRNNITSKYAHRTTLQNTQLLCFKVNVGTVMLFKQAWNSNDTVFRDCIGYVKKPIRQNFLF